MTDLRTAAQQALEALENLYLTLSPESVLAISLNRRITALKAALAEPVQESVQQALCEADRIMGHDDEATEWRERWAHLFGVSGSATSSWRESAAHGCSPGGTGMPAAPPQRPAQPQEPDNGGKTGWPPGLLQDDCRGLSKWLASRPGARQRLREALAEPQEQAQEPCNKSCAPGYCYCAAQKPQRKPLSKEDIERITYESPDFVAFVRAVKAAHDIKEQP